MTYDRAYADSFLIGFGMSLTLLPWLFSGDEFLRFVVGASIIPLVLVIIPLSLIAIHKEVL